MRLVKIWEKEFSNMSYLRINEEGLYWLDNFYSDTEKPTFIWRGFIDVWITDNMGIYKASVQKGSFFDLKKGSLLFNTFTKRMEFHITFL